MADSSGGPLQWGGRADRALVGDAVVLSNRPQAVVPEGVHDAVLSRPTGLAVLEIGLNGSSNYAKKAKEANMQIEAMLNNDIIGNDVSGDGRSANGRVRLFSDGPEDSPSRGRDLHVGAARYGVLSIPTAILFEGGEPKAALIGARPRAHYERALAEVLPAA